MRRRTMANVWPAIVLGMVVTSGRAAAQEPGELVADPNEDHHHMPPEYAAPGWDIPPASAEAPEYPRAAAFVPASTSNYVAGGMGQVQYVVVHTMQGSYGGSINWFQNPDAQVSAHFCMRSSDGEITQMVHLADRAWHVGNSNSYAIGIEHEGFVDDASWYTFAMYGRSAELARWLADHFALPLDREHILGHVELPEQTHTDPGPNWDWELYMALVRDVVGDGALEGVVVDRSRACTLTATSDTFLKATVEDAGALGDDAKCAVPAGTQLRYVHADELHGHWRLALEGDHPCVGKGALEHEAYAYAEHFDDVCAPEDLAANGATVTLDGGEPIAVGPDGRFAIAGIAAGAHAIDAGSAAHVGTNVPFEHAGYPGTRMVVRLDPIDAGDSSGGDDAGDADEGADDGVATSPDPDPSGEDGGTTGEPSSEHDEDALPDTFGEQDDPQGCGCAARGRAGGSAGGPGAMALAGLSVLFARRRRGRS